MIKSSSPKRGGGGAPSPVHSKLLATVSEWNEETRANPVTAFGVRK